MRVVRQHQREVTMPLFRPLSLAVAAVIVAASPAKSSEVTLKAVSAFAENTEFSKNFERFIERVNSLGAGKIKIDYIGGPRAIPSFEVGNAVRGRVVDIANAPGAFYTNLMPEADALKVISAPMKKQRADGTWEYLNELHKKKLNSWYLARQFHNVPFHIYANKKIESVSLSGMKIRVSPIYRDLVQAMGGVAVTTPPGEIYTAMERGVVDGFGQPLTGLFDVGLHKVTKYRLDPGFYSVDVNVLVNLDSWGRLDGGQRAILTQAAEWLEGLDSEKEAEMRAQTKEQAAAGIVGIALGPDEAARFLKLADDVAWDSIIKKSPEHGPKLRAMAKPKP